MNLLKHCIFLVSLIHLLFSYSFADSSYQWSFPKDHGAHHDFNTEWWYFTGHLLTQQNSTYGFELTFFRVSPFSSELENDWSISHLYFAHFAITDEKNKRFHFIERINRDSFNMAGASTNTFNVWNGDWSAKETHQKLLISASSESIQLNLSLDSNTPVVLNGDDGYSVKNHESSQFSYYYSIPKLIGSGTLILENKTISISTANVWFDHEFFNSSLKAENTTPQQQSVGELYSGWDWFAIQLDTGENIMIAQVRSNDNNHHYYFGTWSDVKGNSKSLNSSMISLTTLKEWKSPNSSIIYPSKWAIKIPSQQIDITITPTLANQELRLSHFNKINYWEGRSTVSGSHSGNAYVELVGY